jgi:single-stranded-DNA-specific exonuclease
MWSVREVDDLRVAEIAKTLRLDPRIARCLVARGIASVDAARQFLSPRLSWLRAPKGLAGLEPGLERAARAVLASETIGVFGDYDVDGITTCSILTGFFRGLGQTVVPRVAHRHSGYGLSQGDVAAFADAGASLVLTGDCGTSDLDAIAEASRRGIDVIVIDHHTVPEDTHNHPALALVNPFRQDSEFEFRGLCSAGLAFYFIAALRTALLSRNVHAESIPDPRNWLDLVAVGTIADLVPLTDENRILTAHGLRLLAKQPRPGLSALLEAARVKRAQIDERTVAWKIGPRINAPGRLGDAAPALELLLAETDTQAVAAAACLEQANDARRAEQERVVEQAIARIGADPGPCVIVSGDDWPSGIVGIVAAKLVERTGRPAFVIAADRVAGIGRGSARTAGGVHLYDVLHRVSSLLERYGGHAAAAGFTVRIENIHRLEAELKKTIKEEVQGPVDNSLQIDGEIELVHTTDRLVNGLATLQPFGRGNDEPVFGSRSLTVREARRVGDGSHLKLILEGACGTTRGAIGFGMGEKPVGPGSRVSAAFVPVINRFAGRAQVELELRQLDAL